MSQPNECVHAGKALFGCVLILLLVLLLIPLSGFTQIANGIAEPADQPAASLPTHQAYARLLSAIARYQNIAGQGGWPEFPAGPALTSGQQDTRVPLLRQRLVLAGDLISTVSDDERYGVDLETAVRRFQSRHGLVVDGIVGPATRRALNVSVTARIEQMLINKDRYHRLPYDLGQRYLVVNTAAAMLELIEDEQSVFTSPVIVGAPRTPTPVLQGNVDGIVFNPSWYIPRSIVVNEILPKLRRNYRYLAKENIVIIGRGSDPFGLTIDWSQMSARTFTSGLRQLPGPNNALGRIKFDLHSPYSVYLHDTPQKDLFERSARFFSHGCVRVERARELAAYLLADQGWNENTIDAMIALEATQRVALDLPLPVYLVYLTAFVDAQGTVQFRDDVYNRDRKMVSLLSDRVPVKPAPDSSACGV